MTNERAAEPRALKIGLHIPISEGMLVGRTPRWSDVVAIARRAEEVGFDSVWVADHLLFRTGGRDQSVGIWECWSMLAALAASTSRVELGPLVSCAGYRNPALLAKIADTIDEISGGRVILALGAGWHEAEYEAFGFPFDHRFGRFEEAIQIIHGLLRDGYVDFEGRFYQARDCELRPRGPRPGGPPIMVGTAGPRMLRLTARYAELWNADWTRGPSEIPPLREKVDAACEEVGRDPATLERTACVLVDLPGAQGRGGQGPRTRGVAPHPTAGSPEGLAEFLDGYAREGISHIMVWLDPASIEGLEAFAPTLEILRRSSR